MPANPYATGSGGSDFERRIATAFVCSATLGVSVPPLERAPTAVWLQAAHLEFGFDDIVLETEKSAAPRQRAFVSVKSAISPRASDEEFSDVICKAWKDWQKETRFDPKNDFLVLAVAISRSPRIHIFSQLTEVARASNNDTDFEHRLSLEGYHHSSVRELRPEISAIIAKETKTPPQSGSLWQFLCRIFVLCFDFDQEASQDKARVLGVLALFGETRDKDAAESYWNAVFENLSLGTGKAKIFNAKELNSLRSQHGFQSNASARTRSWLANLRAHCRLNRDGIASSLSENQWHLSRSNLLREFREALSRGQFLLVTGQAGCGKSALALEAAEIYGAPENVFSFQSEELSHPHLDTALQAAGLRDLNPEEWSDALPFHPRVLIIEAVERLLQSNGNREAFTQLLRVAAADRRWRVIVTCRDYLADHVRDTWTAPGGWNVVKVPLLETSELEEAISKSKIPVLWLTQPAVRDALRNLKWFDLTMRASSRIGAKPSLSNWTTVAEWRSFVWGQLLEPDIDPRGEALLVSIGIKRATLGLSWVELDSTSLKLAEWLKAGGILRRHDIFPNRYRPEHDLLEDWALLHNARREFADHHDHPATLFDRLGNSLLTRRAFRQFLGEHLEGDQRQEAILFIRKVFANDQSLTEWEQETVNALLGSSSAFDILETTSDLWIHDDGKRLRLLCHVLKIAYRGRPSSEQVFECPTGPGWAALMKFIYAQGDQFLRRHTRCITGLLLDWHHAVSFEDPEPSGLAVAADLVQGLWSIATEGDEPFERTWGDENSIYMSSKPNRLCWLVAAVAGALRPEFFLEVGRVVRAETTVKQTWDENLQRRRQCRDLLEFIVSDYAGWRLARARPRTMVRLAYQVYGMNEQWDPGHRVGGGMRKACGFRTGSMDYSPPSALRGPFLQLLRFHPRLGEQFVLRVVNEATRRSVAMPDETLLADESIEVFLNIDGRQIIQFADQGWWRCYRGFSPYCDVVECALMAVEKWLLEDIGRRRPGDLEPIMKRLISFSENVAITAVAASVACVHWWHCSKITAALLECWPLLRLDRWRAMNDRTQGRSRDFGWPKDEALYVEERRRSNTLPHRQENLEHLIVKTQFGPGREDIWPVLDMFNAELAGVPLEKMTEELQTARLILHRIDSRNLRGAPSTGHPGVTIYQPVPPAPDLQEHLEESERAMREKMLPMELWTWAHQILDPIGPKSSDAHCWREMFSRARSLNSTNVETEKIMAAGDAPAMVAAACLLEVQTELCDEERSWCVAQVTRVLLNQAHLTEWRLGTMLTGWEAEAAAARACGSLCASAHDGPEQIAIRRATAIALTHPEERVRSAAAEALGRIPTDSSLNLSACELIIRHARFSREVDLRHRGPKRLPYEQIRSWESRCSEIHSEILEKTRTLRERFTSLEPPDLRKLALFYPRGSEEELHLPTLIEIILNHKSPTVTALFGRVRNWLSIQFVDESYHGSLDRKFAADSWRSQDGSLSRSNPVNTGKVARLFARRVLTLPPKDALNIFGPLFARARIAHLRGMAGEFLKDLCIALDDHGKGNCLAFWKVWEGFVVSAADLGAHFNDTEYWQVRRVSKSAANRAFGALVAAVFLNGMHFQSDQKWPPCEEELHRFETAFDAFQVFAVNAYIAFIGTVGGGLLPAAWLPIFKCVRLANERLGDSLLNSASRRHLLRLLGEEVSLRRVASDDQETWHAIRFLLDVLADAGLAEAFRLREQVARI